MKIPKELTTVTPLSKYLARLVFITLPIVGFFFGMRYQEMVDLIKRQEIEANLSIPRPPTTNLNREPTGSAISPAPNGDRASWKTYNDPLNIFSLQYPQNWSESKTIDKLIKKNDSNPVSLGAIAPCPPTSKECTYSEGLIIFELLHKPTNLNLDQFAIDNPNLCKEIFVSKDYSYNPCIGITREIMKKTVSIDGKKSIWQITAGAPSPNKLNVLIPKSLNEVILIYMQKNKEGSPELDPEYLALMEKILSTFQFLP